MLKLVNENYGTYASKDNQAAERHWPRLLGCTVLALTICIFSDQTSKDIYGMMITGVTILTGFTFTALFSDHSLADVGLPKPKNETDILEIARLGELASNFHVRSKYFILLSIIDVCLLIVVSADMSIPGYVSEFAKPYLSQMGSFSLKICAWGTIASGFLLTTLSFMSLVIFLECLYTFYRLSETIIAIVNARRDYMRS